MNLKRKIGQFLKWVIILTVASLVLLAAIYHFRNNLFGPHIQRYLENSIESQTGIRVRIAEIQGTYITDLAVTNVTTLKPASVGPLVAVDLKRIRVAYNPLFLLKGFANFLANAAIELEGANLKFNLSPQEEISKELQKEASSQSFFLPDQLPRIRIQKTSVLLEGSGYRTAFREIELETLHSRPMTNTLQLRIADWSWSHPDLKDGNTAVAAVIEYTKDRLLVKSIILDEQEAVEFVQIGLMSLPEVIPFNAHLNLAEGKIRINGKLDHSDFHAQVEAQHLQLDRIFYLFKPQKRPFAGTLALKANMLLPMEKPTDLVADLDLKLFRGTIYGFAADELDLRAAVKDGKIRLDTFQLRTGSNTIELQELNVPAATVFTGDTAGLMQTLEGRFAFDCRDIPSIILQTGVDFSPDKDSIPAHRLLLNGELRHGNIILSTGNLATDSGYIRLAPSQIALPVKNRPLKDSLIQAGLEINLPNLGLLSRIFSVPQLTGSLNGSATVRGTLGAPSGTAVLNAKGISFGGMTYGDVTVRANADSRKAIIESIALRRERDRLTGRGIFHFKEQEIEAAQLDFQIADLAPYAEKLWPEKWNLSQTKPRIGGSIAGKATISGPLKQPRGTVAIKARQLRFEENLFGDATLRLRSNGQKITIETLEIHEAEDRLALNGSFDLTSRNFENVKMEFSITNFAAYTKNLFPKAGPLAGSIDGSIEVSGPLEEPEARTDVSFKNLQISGYKIPSATFKAHSSGRRVYIDLAEAYTPQGEAKLSGHLLRGPADKNFDMEFTTLSLTAQGARLALDKPGRMHFSSDGELSFKDISLSGPTGSIRLSGTVASHGKTDLDVFVSDLNSNGWLKSLAGERVGFSGLNARIHLSGIPDALSLTITGDLASLGSGEDSISLSGRFDLFYAKNNLVIRQFEWHGQEGQQVVITGTIPVNLLGKPTPRPGPLSVDAKIDLSDLAEYAFYYPDYMPAGGSLQGRFHMTGTWGAPTGNISLKCQGLIPPPLLKPMPPGPFDVDGQIRLDENRVVLESIQIDSPTLNFDGKGEWTGMPALADFFQGVSEKLGGNVDIKGNLAARDLSWLAAENPSLRRVSGRLEANLTMKGPISDPAVDAVVRVTDGELRPDMDVPSLQALNLNAVVTPAGVRLQTFTGELGGAAFQVTGSVTRNSESEAAADLQLQGENLLFYRSEGLKVRADTDLTVKGPLKRLKLAGEVAITDGRLVKYFDLLGTLKGSSKPKSDMGLQFFSIRQSPLSDMVFDVRLTSKNPFKIRNNLAKGAVRPELKLTGTGKIPVLAGKVYVEPTRISLPAGSLVFESGIIRFDPNRPDRPTLDLVGTSKLLGYDVTMLVEGPYDEPVVTLSSVPPLSNEELLLLLITGQQPGSPDDAQASQRQSMNVAVFLGRDLIARWFGSDSAEAGESIMDRFDIGIGRAVTRSGEETIEAQFRLADGVLSDGDKLYLTGEKDIFDFYNAGLKIVFQFK